MSTANRNRLEIQKIIRDSITSCLTNMSRTGWDVMEFANASFQNSSKVILMNYLRSARVGWQSSKYPTVLGVLKRKESWVEEQTWQIHIVCKRVTSAAVTDVLAEDMANELITWFNGPGTENLRAAGVAPLRIDSENIIVYNDNSDLYQKRAVFTLKIQVPKELTFGQSEMNAVFDGTFPV